MRAEKIKTNYTLFESLLPFRNATPRRLGCHPSEKKRKVTSLLDGSPSKGIIPSDVLNVLNFTLSFLILLFIKANSGVGNKNSHF